MGGKEYKELQSCDYRGTVGCRMLKLLGVDKQTRYCWKPGEQALERRKSLSKLFEGYDVWKTYEQKVW